MTQVPSALGGELGLCDAQRGIANTQTARETCCRAVMIAVETQSYPSTQLVNTDVRVRKRGSGPTKQVQMGQTYAADPATDCVEARPQWPLA